MKIAYLAWGSLLWDFSNLKLKTKWKESHILLPLNFSRVSDKGKGRLTLVIDNQTGTPNNIFVAKTKFTNLNKAISAIKTREKTRKSNMGYINWKDESFRTNNLKLSQINDVTNYAKNNNLDAIIWTDISPNFEKITGQKMTTSNAIKYIEEKQNRKKMYIKIIKYIFLCKIYGNIRTPVSNTIIKKLMCNQCLKN